MYKIFFFTFYCYVKLHLNEITFSFFLSVLIALSNSKLYFEASPRFSHGPPYTRKRFKYNEITGVKELTNLDLR